MKYSSKLRNRIFNCAFCFFLSGTLLFDRVGKLIKYLKTFAGFLLILLIMCNFLLCYFAQISTLLLVVFSFFLLFYCLGLLLFFFSLFVFVLKHVMQSPDECFNILIKNMKRVGKLKPAFLKIIVLAHITINYYLFDCSSESRQNNRLLKSKRGVQADCIYFFFKIDRSVCFRLTFYTYVQ